MTEFAVIMLMIDVLYVGFSIGFVAAGIIAKREYDRARDAERRDWFERGFCDGEYARRYYVARWWASESEAYRATFDADCQPGGQWAKAHKLFGEIG